MKKNLSILALMAATAIFFTGCSSNGVSSGDVSNLINGPSSIKGTISGTMVDNTPFSFPYDYHVTINDGNSSSESWIDNSTGDTLLYVWQYFYFDRNGYNDYGDRWSPSGQYVYLEFEFKASTKNKVTTLTLVPKTDANLYLSGMWQNITSTGNRFVYGTLYYRSYIDYSVPPTIDITNLAYDKSNQVITGKLNVALGANNDVQVNSGNHNATNITGDFKIYFPNENFLITKGSNDNGFVYGTHHAGVNIK